MGLSRVWYSAGHCAPAAYIPLIGYYCHRLPRPHHSPASEDRSEDEEDNYEDAGDASIDLEQRIKTGLGPLAHSAGLAVVTTQSSKI